MKRVFSNSSDVIHLFAQKSQTDARCSNVFFEKDWSSDLEYGNKIYSYGHHYLLAQFIGKDHKTIMINDVGYSVTTAKHISEVRWATRQYKQFFVSQTDLRQVYGTIQELKDKLSRARKPEMYISDILHLWEKLNEYYEFDRKDKKLFKKDYNPYYDHRYKEIKNLVKAIQDDSRGITEKLEEHDRKEKARIKRENAKKLKRAIEKFNNYEINSFRIGDEDYLRISQDGEYVETSQNVRVKRENAKALYKLIERGIDIKGRHIEHYTVTSINGTLKIGCHNINMDSVYQVGENL